MVYDTPRHQHRLKHDIQTPYHDTRYTIHTPNEHELNTHRAWYPAWKMTRVQAAQDQVRPPPPVRALCAQRRALQVRLAHHRTSVCLSCFLASLLFAFCVLLSLVPSSPPSYTLLRASCFVLRFSCLFISYEISPRTTNKPNQTDFPLPSSPLPSLHKSHRDKYVARAEWDDLAGRHRALEERVGRMERVLYALHPELLAHAHAPPGVQSSMPMPGLGLGAGIGMGMGLGLGDREGDRERERERDRERRRTVQSPSVGLGGVGLGGMGVGLAGPGTMGTSTDRDRIDRRPPPPAIPIPSSSYPAPPALSNQHPPAHQRRASASALALALHSPRTGMHVHGAQSQSQSHRDRDRDRSRSRPRTAGAGAGPQERPGSSGAGSGFATGEGSGMRGVYFCSFSFRSVQLSFTILFSSLLYLLSFTLLDSTLYSLFGTPCFIHFDVFFFMIQNLSNDYTNRLLHKPIAQPQASNTRSPPTTMTTTNKSPTWRPDGRS